MTSTSELKSKLDLLKVKLNYQDNLTKLNQLKIESEKENLWSNPQTAQDLLQQISDLQKNVDSINEIELDLKNLEDFQIDTHVNKDIEFYTESFKEYLGSIGKINYAT